MMTDRSYIENNDINIEYGGENNQANREKLRANSLSPFELKDNSFRVTIDISNGEDIPQILGLVKITATASDLQNIDYIKITTAPQNEVTLLQTDQVIQGAENLLEQSDRLKTDDAYRDRVLNTTSVSILIAKKPNSAFIKFKINVKGCYESYGSTGKLIQGSINDLFLC